MHTEVFIRRLKKRHVLLCIIAFVLSGIIKRWGVENYDPEMVHFYALLPLVSGLLLILYSIITSPEHEQIWVFTKRKHIMFWLAYSVSLGILYMFGLSDKFVTIFSLIMFPFSAVQHTTLD